MSISIRNIRRRSKELLSNAFCQDTFLTNGANYQHLTAYAYVAYDYALAKTQPCSQEEERHWERGWRKLSYRMTSRTFNCREKPHNELMIASGYSLSQPT